MSIEFASLVREIYNWLTKAVVLELQIMTDFANVAASK